METSFDPAHCTDCLQVQELKLLYEISILIADTRNLEPKLTDALKALKRYLALSKCVVYLVEEEKNALSVFASVDLTAQQQQVATYKMGEGATGQAAQSGEPMVIENVHNNILFLNKTGGRKKEDISYVAVPIVMEERVLGVLGASLTKNSHISFDETVRLLTIVCSLFAQSILIFKEFRDEKKKLSEENRYYRNEVMRTGIFQNIIGNSPKMQHVFDIVDKVARSRVTVLIRGETGTGKELAAAAIHQRSDRKDGPFIKLNCAAIPETLLESELFGHEKGAFTDAREMRKGRFELADGGTLFLDEIGDISAKLQVKLLRVLQEQEFERVGGSKTVKTDVRVVAATNRDLESMVEEGTFREDLFYRLNVIPLDLPPLRERDEDVKLLAQHFLERFSKMHHQEMSFTPDALDAIMEYHWPGNIRELENSVERMVLLAEGAVIDDGFVAAMLPIPGRALQMPAPEPAPSASPIHHDHGEGKILTKSDIAGLEKEAIIEALEESGGVKAQAAKKLGMTVRQIGYKIKKYGIES